MVVKEIKKIISSIKFKYKYNPNKIDKELCKLKDYISSSELYVGKKKQLKKLILDNMKNE